MFRFIYTGNIRRDRGIETILKAIENLDHVELVLAGRIIHKEIGDKVLNSPNVTYGGLLLPNEALVLEQNNDAIITLYDLKFKQNYFAMPNKLFEAMMCQLPIITNIAPEIVAHEVSCGLIVDYNDINHINNAIVTLRDKPDPRRKLGDNSHRAFLQKYNWHIIEKELLKVYETLFTSEISLSNKQK